MGDYYDNGTLDILLGSADGLVRLYTGQPGTATGPTVGDPGGTYAYTDQLAYTSAAATSTLVKSDHPNGSTYGQAVTFTATVSAGSSGTPTGTVQFLVDSTDFGTPMTLSGGTASIVVASLGGGTHQIDAIYTSDTPASFEDSQTTASLPQVVNPAPLTITADSASKTYGAADPGFTVSGSGFAPGETVANLGGTLVFATNEPAGNAPVGSYTVMPSGLTSTNYAITFMPGTLTVTTASPQLTLASPPATIAYDGTADVTNWAGTQLTGAAGASAPTGSPTLLFYAGTSATGAPLTYLPVNAGTYTALASYAGDANYAATQSARSHSSSNKRRQALRLRRRRPALSPTAPTTPRVGSRPRLQASRAPRRPPAQ